MNQAISTQHKSSHKNSARLESFLSSRYQARGCFLSAWFAVHSPIFTSRTALNMEAISTSRICSFRLNPSTDQTVYPSFHAWLLGCHQQRPLDSVVVWWSLRHGQWQRHHFAAERVLRVAPEAATWLGMRQTYPLEIGLPN